MHKAIISALFLGVVVIVGGCGDERNAPGMVITSDGRFLSNSPATARGEAERSISSSLEEALGPAWSVTTTIAELPVYRENAMGSGDWTWEACTAKIVLGGSATPKISLAEIKSGVERYLGKKMRRSSDGLVVTVEVQAKPAVTSVPVQLPAPAGPRTYKIQAGDTLADISVLHFASTERWRDILAANPGLAADHLVPGQVIVIPVR